MPEIIEKIKDTKIERYGLPKSPNGFYVYNNITFDSSWELAFYIYLSDNKVDFEYQPKLNFEYYTDDGMHHYYIPDFKVGDSIIEIKGDHFFNEQGQLRNPYNNMLLLEKQKVMNDNNVIIYKQKEIQPYIDYIDNTYGKDYLSQFRKTK